MYEHSGAEASFNNVNEIRYLTHAVTLKRYQSVNTVNSVAITWNIGGSFLSAALMGAVTICNGVNV